METKSLKKQLMAAIAMLVVAAIALASATYAWFAQNTKVKAETMTVKATTSDPFLQISTDDSTWKTQILDLEATTEKDLKLVAPKTIAYGASTWYEAESDDADIAVTAYSANTVADVDDKEAEHMLFQQLYLRNASENTNATNLTAKATITGAQTDNLETALRVLVIDENGGFVVFDSTGTVLSTGLDAYADSNDVLEDTFDAGAKSGIEVYVYFDGTDENATTNMAKDLTDCVVSLEFSIIAPTK